MLKSKEKNKETAKDKAPLFKRIVKKLEINKSKVLTSLLTSAALSFFLFIYSTFSVFFNNAKEFFFSIMDFGIIYIPAFLICTLLGMLVLLVTKKRVHYFLYSLAAGVAICAYVQSFITNITFKGLPGDGVASPPTISKIIINMAVWVVFLAAFVFFGTYFKKADVIRKFIPLGLILITVMQIFSLVPSAINYINNNANKFKNNELYVLTKENQLELSSEENIIVLLLDSFDREYFLEYLNEYPDAMDEFDGFTYYDDNVATYPRTFPALVSILTGATNDFSLDREEFFRESYKNSPFLKDLKANGYKINLFMPIYYGYDNADVFAEYSENISLAEGYKITSYKNLTKKMLLLSSYFWAPQALKSNGISASEFTTVGTFLCDGDTYNLDGTSDPALYQDLKNEGLNTDSDKKVFSFLHLRGCHPPFAMNENCEQVEPKSVSSLQQTTGVFKIVKEYLRQMKELGIYENSTIIITGDHSGPDAWEDISGYSHAMNTALLVKPKGAAGTAFRTSEAQVSQDNLFAEIVKSAGLETDHDYGRAYSDISEDEVITRTHYFLRYTGAAKRRDELVTYEITGDSTNFDNWKIVDRKDVGCIYD